LLEDCWWGVHVGRVKLKVFLNLLSFYKDEKDTNCWSLIYSYVRILDRIVDESLRGSFENWVSDLVENVFAFVGFEPRNDDSQELRELRSGVVCLKAFYGGDKELIDCSVKIFNDGGLDSIVDGDFYESILSLSAVSGDISIDVFLDRFKNSKSPQIQHRYSNVLSAVENEKTSNVVVNAMLDGVIRPADVPLILASLISSKSNGRSCWDLFVKNFDKLLSVMTEKTTSLVLRGLSGVYDRDFANVIVPFVKANPLPASKKASAQNLERLESNLVFADRLREQFSEEIFK